MHLLTIKVGKEEYNIDEKSKFMDNGACVQLLIKDSTLRMTNIRSIRLPKREIKRLSKFLRVSIKSKFSADVFTITANNK